VYLEAFAGLDLGVVERSGECNDARFVVAVERGGYLPDVLFADLFLGREPRLEARVFVDLRCFRVGRFEVRPCLRCGFAYPDALQQQSAVREPVVGREVSRRAV